MVTKAFNSMVVVLIGMFTAGSLFAHHSFGMFDGERVLRMKGVVTKFEWINPHSFIVIDVKTADGKTEQWALEGPAPNSLVRRGYWQDFVKPGQAIEACGYPLKAEYEHTHSRQVLNVELLTVTNDEPLLWQDYGQRKCRESQTAQPATRR
jgi:hypothetical protein